jgi:Caspase domain
VSRALVAIGVSRAPPLDNLGGALTDAEELAQWARDNKYEHVHLFTDRKPGSVVRANDIFTDCKKLLDERDLEHLVIFFAGHGYSPLPGHEVWLLSGWAGDANEAINASGSLLVAKGFARPRIAFMADACRTTADEFLGTTGLVILPKPLQRSGNSQVDEFYATAFGDVSQQYKPAQRLKSYGIFSRELLTALKGAAATDRDADRLVTSRSLEDYLTDAVPKACAKIPDAAIQYPDTHPKWQKPNDVYAELHGPPSLARGPTAGEPPPAVRRNREERDRRIRKEAERYQAAEGRESFETATGATILGAEVTRVVGSPGGTEHFLENDAWQIRVFGISGNEMPRQPASLMVQVNNARWPGYWMSIPVFPGLIATALVDENGFSSLNYRVTRSLRTMELALVSRELESMLAEASAMFRFGLLPARDRLRQIVDRLRDGKFENPALAIVAAHICYRLGELEQIFDMEKFEIGRGPYTPYDFLLLTGRKKPARVRRTVGYFPLLSPAWGLLPVAEVEVDQRLQSVMRGLAPSLWTFANPDAGAVLAEIVEAYMLDG